MSRKAILICLILVSCLLCSCADSQTASLSITSEHTSEASELNTSIVYEDDLPDMSATDDSSLVRQEFTATYSCGQSSAAEAVEDNLADNFAETVVTADSAPQSVHQETVFAAEKTLTSAESMPLSAAETDFESIVQSEQAEKAEYDFSMPVPQGEIQDKSYFDDAVFIGNSRMVGFGAYSELDNITVYAHSGLNVRSIYDDACIETESGKITILEALKQTPDCKKIYLKMGTNELGWPYYNVFIKEYVKLIEEMKLICPDALIYVHSVLPVAKKKSEIDPYENQPNINIMNEMLQDMCEENKYFYLDVQSAYLDEEGYLLSSVTFDGSHIRYPHYPQWVDYLLSHTVEGCGMLLPDVSTEDIAAETSVPDTTEQPSAASQNEALENDLPANIQPSNE